MLNFTTDQWVIIALVFVLGLLFGGFLFSGGGRKWRHKYNAEAERRADLERVHAEREKDWREQDSLRAAALKNQTREPVVERVVERDVPRDAPRDVPLADTNRDGVIDSRDA